MPAIVQGVVDQPVALGLVWLLLDASDDEVRQGCPHQCPPLLRDFAIYPAKAVSMAINSGGAFCPCKDR